MSVDIQRGAKFFNVPLVTVPPTEITHRLSTLAPQRCVARAGDFAAESSVEAKTDSKPMCVLSHRLLKAVEMQHEDKLEALTRELWMANWHRHEPVAEARVMQAACETVGFSTQEAQDLVKAIESEEVKKALKDTTEEAVREYGVFGAPAMVVQHPALGEKPQLFFGSDRLEYIALSIGECALSRGCMCARRFVLISSIHGLPV